MLGTKWVAPGEGATAVELEDVVGSASEQGRQFWQHLHELQVRGGQTNLALTGEPLTDYDLRRIAVCE